MSSISGGNTSYLAESTENRISSNLTRSDGHMRFSSGLAHNLNADNLVEKHVS